MNDMQAFLRFWFPINTSYKLWSYLLPFASFVTLKSVFFDYLWSATIEKTSRFWSVVMTFSERYNTRDGRFFFILLKNIWWWGRNNDQCLEDFLPSWPGFRTFHRTNVVLSINRTHEDTLLTYLVQIGRETAGRRREKSREEKLILLQIWNEMFFLLKRQ